MAFATATAQEQRQHFLSWLRARLQDGDVLVEPAPGLWSELSKSSVKHICVSCIFKHLIAFPRIFKQLQTSSNSKFLDQSWSRACFLPCLRSISAFLIFPYSSMSWKMASPSLARNSFAEQHSISHFFSFAPPKRWREFHKLQACPPAQRQSLFMAGCGN